MMRLLIGLCALVGSVLISQAMADTSVQRNQEVRNDHYRAEQSVAKNQVKRNEGGSQNGFNLPGGGANNAILDKAFKDAKAGLNGLKTRAPVADEAQRQKVNTALEDIIMAYMVSRRAAHAPVGVADADPFMMMIGQLKLNVTKIDLSAGELSQLEADLQVAKDYLSSWSI